MRRSDCRLQLSDARSSSDEPRGGSSSQELMARIRSATERTETLFNVHTTVSISFGGRSQRIDAPACCFSWRAQDVRELEKLEAAAATAQCTEPRQLQLRIARVRALRDELAAMLDMKPVLLQTLRKNAATESLDVEMEHQRSVAPRGRG